MRKWLALGVQVPFLAMMWVACSSDDQGTPDGGDGSVQDVKLDKKTPIESSVVDTGSACAPSDVSQSDLKWAPPNPHTAACTDQQLTDLYNQCFSGQGNCATFLNAAANATCKACLVTQDTATTWGAIVVDSSGGGLLNVGGCLSLELADTSSTGCGGSYQQRLECEYLACSTNCAQASSSEFDACLSTAATGTCVTQNNAVNSTCGDGGTASDACGLNATTGLDYVKAVAGAFCGGYVADAGTDSGASDASTDAATDAALDAAVDAPDGD